MYRNPRFQEKEGFVMTRERPFDIVANLLEPKGGGSAGDDWPFFSLCSEGFVKGLAPSVVTKIKIAEVELARDVAASKAKAYEAILRALAEPHA